MTGPKNKLEVFLKESRKMMRNKNQKTNLGKKLSTGQIQTYVPTVIFI